MTSTFIQPLFYTMLMIRNKEEHHYKTFPHIHTSRRDTKSGGKVGRKEKKKETGHVYREGLK